MGLITLNLPNPEPGKRSDALLGPWFPVLFSFSDVRFSEACATNSGQFVTPQTAMRASAVLACMRILSEDLIGPAAESVSGARRKAHSWPVDHPLFRLLHDSPNTWQTSMELRESMVLDVLCYGNSFTEKEIGPDGISALYPLSAARMVFVNPLDDVHSAACSAFLRYADPRSGQRVLLSDDLWITRMLAPGGTIEGTSLILLAREAIGLALAAEEQGARLFQHGIQTDLTYHARRRLDTESKDQLRKSIHGTARRVSAMPSCRCYWKAGLRRNASD